MILAGDGTMAVALQSPWAFLHSLGAGLARTLGAGLLLLATPAGGATLVSCYQKALTMSESVAIAGLQADVAAEHLSQAKGAILPSLSASYVAQRQEEASTALARSFSPASQNTGKLTANQPVFRGLREFNALTEREELRAKAERDQEQARVQLFLDVSQAFFDALAATLDQEHFQGEIAANEQRLLEVRRNVRAGRARAAEVLLVESTIASLEAQAESARGQTAVAREGLRHLCALGDGERLDDPTPLPSAPPSLAELLPRSELRPDLAAARRDVKAAAAAVDGATGQHLPSVDLTGNYYLQRPGLASDIHWDVQLVASLPIYGGGVVSSQVREAVLGKRAKELALALTGRRAEQEIRRLHALVTAEFRQITMLANAAEVSAASYEAKRQDYHQGLATTNDVLQASTSHQDAVRALDRARIQAKADLARLDAATARVPAAAPVR